MDALTFLQKHGKDVAAKVAARAGTNYAYFSQIARGHRRPSIELASELVSASQAIIENPDHRLDLLALLSIKRPVSA